MPGVALTGEGWSTSVTNMASKKDGTTRYNIGEAKARFSELVQKAMLGEDVVIAKDHKPLLKLVALEAPSRPRKPGSARGQIWMADDFDTTPADFEGYA